MKPNFIIPIKSEVGQIFRNWLEITRPLHKFAPREMDVAAKFLEERHRLSSSIIEDSLLDKIALSEDIKKRVREYLGLSVSHFHTLVGTLRKKGFFTRTSFNKRYIPTFDSEGKFIVSLIFEMLPEE